MTTCYTYGGISVWTQDFLLVIHFVRQRGRPLKKRTYTQDITELNGYTVLFGCHKTVRHGAKLYLAPTKLQEEEAKVPKW